VSENFRLRASQKGIILTTHIEQIPSVTGDADRLVQVFSNLTENALEHTPEGGQVRVTAQPAPGGVQIAFADTGRGIPQEDAGRIFERFYQADKSRARTGKKGTGLGLTISWEIIQAHGGSIQVESAEGRGSTFFVWLPLPRHSDETARRASR
jgi:two-component system sensor histidine kinase ResE